MYNYYFLLVAKLGNCKLDVQKLRGTTVRIQYVADYVIISLLTIFTAAVGAVCLCQSKQLIVRHALSINYKGGRT